MRDLFKFEKQNNYPHMSVRDKLIYERFLDKYPTAYKMCQYDFHIGDAPPFNTLDDDETDRNQDMLYRLRIDVVAHTDKGIDILEIKPDAGTSTIGQIKSYRTLYVRDEEPKLPVGMIIVTDKERPNMRYLCQQEGISLVVV